MRTSQAEDSNVVVIHWWEWLERILSTLLTMAVVGVSVVIGVALALVGPDGEAEPGCGHGFGALTRLTMRTIRHSYCASFSWFRIRSLAHRAARYLIVHARLAERCRSETLGVVRLARGP